MYLAMCVYLSPVELGAGDECSIAVEAREPRVHGERVGAVLLQTLQSRTQSLRRAVHLQDHQHLLQSGRFLQDLRTGSLDCLALT